MIPPVPCPECGAQYINGPCIAAMLFDSKLQMYYSIYECRTDGCGASRLVWEEPVDLFDLAGEV